MSKLPLEQIVKQLNADSVAIMMPRDTERHLFCYDSFNMPQEWIDIKNPYDEDVPGGNVEVYHTGKPATTNHLKKNLKGYFIESVMIVPIKRDDKTIAMLELIHNRNDKTFSEQDLEQAQEFIRAIEPQLPN